MAYMMSAGGDNRVGKILKMRVSRVDGCALVWLGGEMDVAEAAEARAFLTSAVCDGRDRIVVDVTDLSFIDAAGIGVLVAVARQTALDGGWLRLVGASLLLRRMLAILGLTGFLPVFDSVDAALAARVDRRVPRRR